VSDFDFGWTDISVSRLERWITTVGLGISAVALIASLTSIWVRPSISRAGAAIIATLVACVGFVIAKRRRKITEIRMESGSVLVRVGSQAEPTAATVTYSSSWLAVLVADRRTIAIWPDSVGSDNFRRLIVVSRWCVQRRVA
jgi:hypothetical protein